MISTKGRYSIRILLDLAEHGSSGGYTPMKEVAVRQDISLKYIERILPPLKNAGLIASTHGIGGGYRLTRPPEDYTLWEILCIAEGDLAPWPAYSRTPCPAPARPSAGRCGLAGLLQADRGLFFRHHAGRPDERAAGRQLCDLG